MITLYRAAYEKAPRAPEFYGISTDEKPTKIGEDQMINGSFFTETDTGIVYRFDAENNQWIAQS